MSATRSRCPTTSGTGPTATPLDVTDQAWSSVQLGNCGSPIELAEGWLVLTHGVGAMRTYSIGALLLDIDDPTVVIGQTTDPLIGPAPTNRTATCRTSSTRAARSGTATTSVVPFGIADSRIGFATLAIADVLAAMSRITPPADLSTRWSPVVAELTSVLFGLHRHRHGVPCTHHRSALRFRVGLAVPGRRDRRRRNRPHGRRLHTSATVRSSATTMRPAGDAPSRSRPERQLRMRRFACEHCGSPVRFDASTCPVCCSPLGYVPVERTIRMLHPVGDDVSYLVDGTATLQWRCLNAPWGCNWMLPAAEGAIWCRSCRLTRGRPDDGRPDAIAAWSFAEAAKRRLVHQLDRLGLPVETPSRRTPAALVFDLVHLPGERGLTGHLDGVVTFDLAEADPVHREALRRQLGEPFRTVLGSLRHEVGHHYWRHLVVATAGMATFRAVFGDERADYGAALQHYYADDAGPWDDERFVSAVRAVPPARGLGRDVRPLPARRRPRRHRRRPRAARRRSHSWTTHSPCPPVPRSSTSSDAWRTVGDAVDDLADTVGSAHPYPVRPRRRGRRQARSRSRLRHRRPTRSTDEMRTTWPTNHHASTSRRRPARP